MNFTRERRAEEGFVTGAGFFFFSHPCCPDAAALKISTECYRALIMYHGEQALASPVRYALDYDFFFFFLKGASRAYQSRPGKHLLFDISWDVLTVF